MTERAVWTEGLSLRIDGFTVLERADISLPSGAFTAVLGPNGAGKSTLLKILLGLETPTEGRVEVLGHSPAKLPPGLVGYVPQLKTVDRSFPALTCEVVASGLLRRWPWRLSRALHEQAEQALGQAGAEHLAHRPFSVLSGGEVQRVYLARALMRKPRLILLDEPAAGIDAAGEDLMYGALEKYRRDSGATIVMVTHDWGAAFHHASCVLLMNKRVVACAPPGEALSDENLRQAFGHGGHAHAMSWGGGPAEEARHA